MQVETCCSYNCNAKNPGQHKPWPEIKKLTPREKELRGCDMCGPSGCPEIELYGYCNGYDPDTHTWLPAYRCRLCQNKVNHRLGLNLKNQKESCLLPGCDKFAEQEYKGYLVCTDHKRAVDASRNPDKT